MATLPEQDGMDSTTRRNFASTLTEAQRRHLVILSLLGDASAPMTCSEILEQIKAREGIDNVSKKTIERDLADLALKYPIECKVVGRTGHWSRKPGAHLGYLLPILDRKAAAAFLIMEAHLRHVLPPSVVAQLEPWFVESKALLLKDCDDEEPWFERVVTEPEGMPLIPPPVTPDVLEAVYECLQHQFRLKIDYRNRQGKSNSRVVHPEGLIASRRTLYLAASIDGGYDDITDFALHRMSNPEVLRHDDKAELFEPGTFKEHVEEGFLKFYLSDEPVELLLEFAASAAPTLRECKLSENQTTEELDGGRLRVRAHVYDTQPLRAWLLSYGDLVRVIAPESLRDDIRSRLQAALAQYAQCA